MIIHQISVFVENRYGSLCAITEVLKENNIDIRALCIADTTDFGILRLIVDKPDEAVTALKTAGVTVTKTEVIAARLNDTPGALNSILTVLKDAAIGVEYVYAFITRKDADACVILRVEDNAQAIKALRDKGETLLSAGEIYAL